MCNRTTGGEETACAHEIPTETEIRGRDELNAGRMPWICLYSPIHVAVFGEA